MRLTSYYFLESSIVIHCHSFAAFMIKQSPNLYTWTENEELQVLKQKFWGLLKNSLLISLLQWNSKEYSTKKEKYKKSRTPLNPVIYWFLWVYRSISLYHITEKYWNYHQTHGALISFCGEQTKKRRVRIFSQSVIFHLDVHQF